MSASRYTEYFDVQLDDVRVSEQLQVLNLPLHPARHISTDQLLPRNNLQGDLLIGDPVDSQLDFAKGALAQRPDDLVGADALFCLLLRRWLNGTVIVAIWTARTGIRRFIVRTTVRGGCERDLELAIFVGPVRHHCGVVCCFLGELWFRGGMGTVMVRRCSECPTNTQA